MCSDPIWLVLGNLLRNFGGIGVSCEGRQFRVHIFACFLRLIPRLLLVDDVITVENVSSADYLRCKNGMYNFYLT